MILNWEEYIFRFRTLVAQNFIIVKSRHSSIYYWVDRDEYPPKKRTFKEAWNYAIESNLWGSSVFPISSEIARGIAKHNRTLIQSGWGTHYKKFAIQPIEFVLANNLSYIEGNIIKYICRWRDKGGIEDLKKIKHYVDLLINFEEITNGSEV